MPLTYCSQFFTFWLSIDSKSTGCKIQSIQVEEKGTEWQKATSQFLRRCLLSFCLLLLHFGFFVFTTQSQVVEVVVNLYQLACAITVLTKFCDCFFLDISNFFGPSISGFHNYKCSLAWKYFLYCFWQKKKKNNFVYDCIWYATCISVYQIEPIQDRIFFSVLSNGTSFNSTMR